MVPKKLFCECLRRFPKQLIMATKIYTKTGDKGTTGLFGGARVSKDDIRLEAYGTVDECNAFVGHLSDHVKDQKTKDFLTLIQNKLFVVGAILATDPDKPELKMAFDESIIAQTEKHIDEMQEVLDPLANFILPSGHPTVSLCHIARTVSRRAERRAVSLSEHTPVDLDILIFLNRLSDYFFVLGRYQAKELGVEEVIWD